MLTRLATPTIFTKKIFLWEQSAEQAPLAQAIDT